MFILQCLVSSYEKLGNEYWKFMSGHKRHSILKNITNVIFIGVKFGCRKRVNHLSKTTTTHWGNFFPGSSKVGLLSLAKKKLGVEGRSSGLRKLGSPSS